MNKKYYYGLFAAGMLFATSCSNDELTQVQSGEYAEVSISLGVEEVAGSRAISDGKGANELHYAVFDAQGKRIEGIKPVQDKEVTFPTTETLTLAKGQTYKVAFWAQNKACQAYTVSPEMNVTVDYDGVNNDETRDAFFKTVEFIVNGSTALDVELTRPFAQINVGVDAADWNAAVASGVEIVNSNVAIKNAATSINLVTGKVSGSDAVNYGIAAIPSEDLAANEGTYKWLSMSYILANDGSETGDAEATLTSLAYTFYSSGNPITFSEGLNNIPVRRNYRTNILGKILTGDIDFKISIDNRFDKPDYNHIYAGGSSANPERLEDAMAKINANPEANPVIKIPAKSYVSWTTGAAIGSTPLVNAENEVTQTVTIQGEGENSVLVVGGAGVGSLRAANGAKVIFKNMTIVDNSVSYAENAWEYTYLEFAGKLEFENVTFKGGIQLQAEDNDVLNATFKNCTFITEEESVYGVWVSDGTSTFSNCKFQGTRGLKMHEAYGSDITSVTIDGCEFGPLSKKPGVAIGDLNAGTTVTIKNSTFNGCQAGEQGLYIYETDTDVTAFNFTESNNIYINNNVATAEELAAALTAGVAKINVVLQNDIELPITSLGQITGGSGEYKLGGENTEDITIDLNGHKLNVTTTYWSNLGAKNDDALFTIKNGTMTSSQATGTWNSYDVTFSNCNYVIEDVVFGKAIAFANANKSATLKNVTINETHDYYAMWITAEGQNVDIDGLTINSDGRGIKIDEQYVGTPEKVTLEINNATFNTAKKAAIVVKSAAGAEIKASNLNIDAVAEDNYHAVWVDKDAAAYADKVVVNGAFKAVEGTVAKFDNPSDLAGATIENNSTILLSAGDYVIPAAAKGKHVTFIGTGNPVDVKVGVTKVGTGGENCDYGLDGSTVTFENITITTNSSTYIGYARCNGTYKNCIINGTYTLYGNSYFENCTFNVSGDVYNIWTWGAPTATFVDCTFNSDGKSMLLYGQANTKLTINGCTFNDNGTIAGKAAIEIGNDYNKSYELTVNNTIVKGFDINTNGISTGTTLWANKNSMGTDKLNVVVDGVDVY